MGESCWVTAAPNTAAPAGQMWALSIFRIRAQPLEAVGNHAE